MTLKLARILPCVLLFALLIFPGCTTPHPQPVAIAIPFQHVEIGLCEDYPAGIATIEGARRDFALLQTNHIRVLRIAFAWDSIETQPGQCNWTFWDSFVRIATDEFGIRLIPYVCYTPRWNSQGNDTNYWRQPPRDLARFSDFMKQIVLRYKDRIHSWEIWNEPDNPEYWEGSVAQYADLLRAGSQAVRESDPTAKVVAGGLAWNLEFLHQLLAVEHAGPAIDIVNLHSYYETWSSDPVEAIATHVRRAAALIRESGNHQPIWLAEIGYSNYRNGDYVSYSYTAHRPYEHSPEFQARTLARAIASALATGEVKLIAWYRIHDLPATTQVIGDVNNRFLGVVDVTGRPKPALKTLSFLQSLFLRDFHCLDPAVYETRTIASDAQAHVFERTNHELLAFTWLSIPMAQTNTEFESHENLTLLVPNRYPASARVFDETGAPQGNVSLHTARSGTRLLDLNLRENELRVYDLAPSR